MCARPRDRAAATASWTVRYSPGSQPKALATTYFPSTSKTRTPRGVPVIEPSGLRTPHYRTRNHSLTALVHHRYRHGVESRPKIPASIKREIRQRCGFGCVICGCPVFDYEHIEGIGATGHNPSHMTLLCPTHHREKTVGRMPVSVVRDHDAHPFNTGATFGAGHPPCTSRRAPSPSGSTTWESGRRPGVKM